MRKWLRRIGFLVLLVGVAAFVAYEQLWKPVPVVVAEATQEPLLVEVSGTGVLDAHLSAVISSKIAGRISSIEVDQDDHVEEERVVFRLDDSDLRRQVEIGEATVEAASAAINRAETDIARSTALLELARRDAERTQAAYDQGSASVSELDRILQQAKVAEAELARAEASVVEASRQHAAAERTLGFYRAQLAETVIVSPFDGIIVRRDRDPGDVVVPGSSIVRIVDPNELWLSAWVDETAIASLAPDQEARIVFRSEPEREYRGHVVRVGLEVDPESREFLVDIALEELPRRWAVGQRAEAYIVTEKIADALTVPGEFIVARDGRRGVYVLRNDRAVWRECELGARGHNRVEVVNGIDAGDRVVRGLDETASRALRPGKRVAAP